MKLPMKLVGVKTPSYANPGDAGLDLRVQRIISNDGDMIVYGTGTHVKIPDNVVGLLIPRSSVRKYDLVMKNSIGVIDSGFIGEIQATFLLTKFADESKIYEVGDRCCQLVLVPFIRPNEIVIVDELEETERGSNGHGSTGL